MDRVSRGGPVSGAFVMRRSAFWAGRHGRARDRRIASDYRTRRSAYRLRIMRVIDHADLRLNGATGEAPAAGRSGEHRGDEFAAATDADFVEHRLEVILNGVFGDVQRGRDDPRRGSA